MSRPPQPPPPPLDAVEELIQRLRSVRAEAKNVIADPARRKSVWAKDSKVSLAEAEQEIALGRVVLWLESHGGDWGDTRPLRALFRRLHLGNPQAEEERRQACRELVLAAWMELTSTDRRFGPDRMTRSDGAAWLARRFPEEVTPIFAGRQTGVSELAAAIINLRDRADRKKKSKGDSQLADDVKQRLDKLKHISRDGTPFRQWPRIERAEKILALLREAFPA